MGKNDYQRGEIYNFQSTHNQSRIYQWYRRCAGFRITTVTGSNTYGKFRLVDGRLLNNSPDTDNGSIDNGVHPNDKNKIVINNGLFAEGTSLYELLAF